MLEKCNASLKIIIGVMMNSNTMGNGTIVILKPVPLASINFNLALKNASQYPYEVCDIPCCCRNCGLSDHTTSNLARRLTFMAFVLFIQKNSLHRPRNTVGKASNFILKSGRTVSF